jgi:hypothetical protein
MPIATKLGAYFTPIGTVALTFSFCLWYPILLLGAARNSNSIENSMNVRLSYVA